MARVLGDIALQAGRLVASLQTDSVAHEIKADGTPTTAADLAAEHLIVERLRALWPAVPVIAEETSGASACGDAFFLVDPLDGTSDYMRGGVEFTVNIAFVTHGRPVAAALAAPALGRLWIAGERAFEAAVSEGHDAPAYRPAQTRALPPDGATVLVSRRHADPAEERSLARVRVAATRTASSALKFGLIASGEADLYVRCGPTMEWDTAAGDHILARAGGRLIGADGRDFRYGRAERLYRNGAFAALGHADLAAQITLPPDDGQSLLGLTN